MSRGNNAAGINSFSGPMGQKEPAYGAVQRMKVATSLAPIGSTPALTAPDRAKRAATSGRGQQPAAAPGPPPPDPNAPGPQIGADQQPQQYQQEMQAFWQQLAMEPGVSPLIQQLARQAVAGA